jgi:hypothetical protein
MTRSAPHRCSSCASWAFERAVDEVTAAAREYLDALVTHAPARNREVEAVKARARAAERFGRSGAT